MTFMNEGMWDRIIRIVLAVALGYAAWVVWPGTAAMAFLVIGAIALVTGVVGWCPMYTLFRTSTKKKAAA
jgi:hypothetical protein